MDGAVWVGDGQVAAIVEGEGPAAFVDAVVMAVTERQKVFDVGRAEMTEPFEVMDVAVGETCLATRNARR